jgi:hypothetical protein
MPRIREDVEAVATPGANTVGVLSDETVGEVAPAPERATRTRRPAPEGVTLGMVDSPVPVEAPVTGASTGRRGKPTSQKTIALIEACKASPGQWFLVGEFLSPQNPTKTSVLGSAGLVFSNERMDRNGTVTFVRKACMPVAEG